MGNGPVRCDACEETWPKGLAPVLKGEHGCPACSPETFR